MSNVSIHPAFLNPSVYAHTLHGFLFMLAIALTIYYFPKLISIEPYKKISLILFFSLVLGIHSLSHLGLESVYGYNPFTFVTTVKR